MSATRCGFSGFRKLAAQHWRYGAGEMARSVSKRRFVRAVRRLVPEVTVGDLEPALSGVRAQAVTADGDLVDDFAFHRVGHALHVLNAPSPAATASLEIGKTIAANSLSRSVFPRSPPADRSTAIA